MAKASSVPTGVNKAIISGIELNAEQKARIKRATGVDVSFLLVQHVGGAEVRNIEPSALQILAATWCW